MDSLICTLMSSITIWRKSVNRNFGYLFVIFHQSLPPPWRLCFRRCLSCLLEILHKNFHTHLHEIFIEGWQWANEQLIKFWWRSRSPSGYRDCFPDLSLLGDTESGINRLRSVTMQFRACIGRHCNSNYDSMSDDCPLKIMTIT